MMYILIRTFFVGEIITTGLQLETPLSANPKNCQIHKCFAERLLCASWDM